MPMERVTLLQSVFLRDTRKLDSRPTGRRIHGLWRSRAWLMPRVLILKAHERVRGWILGCITK